MVNNNILKKIKSSNWIQAWAGDWNLLNVYDWGEHFLTIKFGNKPFLKKVIFLIQDGKISAWFDSKDIKESTNRLLTEIGYNLNKVEELSSQIRQKTDIALKYMDENKNKISLSVYHRHCQNIRNYYEYHTKIKYLPDILSEKLMKRFLPILEDARIYAEPIFTQTLEFDKCMSKILAQKVNIKNSNLLLYMSKSELKNAFNKKIIPDEKKLKARHDLSALVFLTKSPRLYTGTEAKSIENSLADVNPTLLKGTTAYAGKVSGTVRIIKDPGNVKVFNKGDILVAPMTRPEYLPLMKKSGAMVTEAGGILSHAAITAREIKKPCVIGTMIATKILKDGDIVEVDANKGIIKIIKKN